MKNYFRENVLNNKVTVPIKSEKVPFNNISIFECLENRKEHYENNSKLLNETVDILTYFSYSKNFFGYKYSSRIRNKALTIKNNLETYYTVL